MDNMPQLTAKQKMVILHLVAELLHDPSKVGETLSDVPAKLEELGLNSDDIDNIKAMSNYLSNSSEGKVGW